MSHEKTPKTLGKWQEMKNPGPNSRDFFQSDFSDEGHFGVPEKSEEKGGSFMTRIYHGKLQKLVFARYIRRHGKVVYPTKAKVFRFWVNVR